MTIMQTALALVATNIGGGILGIPFAFYRMGLVLGPIFVLMMALLSQISTMMILKVKDMTPRKLESVYEIAYLLFGRPSIFVVCITMFLGIYGALILYYIIIGDTVSTLMMSLLLGADHAEKDIDLDNEPWYVQLSTHRSFGVLIMAAS